MLQTLPEHVADQSKVEKKVINDFCITFSTVNGSGSATANT